MTNRHSFREKLTAVISIGVGIVLIRSASIHLQNSYAFLASIYSYAIVGRQIGVFAAVVLPALQLVVGLMLVLFMNARKFALSVAAGLFVIYSAVQCSALARGLNISCGCFGSDLENPVTWASVAFSVCLAAISMAAAAFQCRSSLNASKES